MASLDLTQDRGYHEIEALDYQGQVVKYKIPKELKVSQVERILDLQLEAEKIAKQKTKEDGGVEQLRLFWAQVFAQLYIMFKVYQPNITEQELRQIFSQQEALSITGFFSNNRFLKIGEDQDQKKTQ